MGVVKTILLVAFVIICILLVLLVLVQNEDRNGMGSAFGGGQSTAFGAHSASVLVKTTGVLVALFFVITLGIALANRPSDNADISKTVEAVQGASSETEEDDWTKEVIEADKSGADSAEAAETVETAAE